MDSAKLEKKLANYLIKILFWSAVLYSSRGWVKLAKEIFECGKPTYLIDELFPCEGFDVVEMSWTGDSHEAPIFRPTQVTLLLVALDALNCTMLVTAPYHTL